MVINHLKTHSQVRDNLRHDNLVKKQLQYRYCSSEIQAFKNLTVGNILGVDFSFLQHYPKMLQIKIKLFKTQSKSALL